MLVTTSWLKCNDFCRTKTMKDSNETIKHFRLKIKTKTKSKMPAEMNTVLHGELKCDWRQSWFDEWMMGRRKRQRLEAWRAQAQHHDALVEAKPLSCSSELTEPNQTSERFIVLWTTEREKSRDRPIYRFTDIFPDI